MVLMALTFSINLDDADFSDLSTLVDAARSSGVTADARVRLQGSTLTVTVEPSKAVTRGTHTARATSPEGEAPRDGHVAPPLPFDAGPLKDAVRQVITDTLLNNPPKK